MTNNVEQIPFALPTSTTFDRDDFFVGLSNQAAVNIIDQWPKWDMYATIIVGPEGCGKSHLANIWQKKSNAISINTIDDNKIANINMPSNILIENITTNCFKDNALFHLLNIVKENNSNILITSRTFPTTWNIKLPDLITRLKAAIVIEMHEPDDLLLKAIFIKLLADRQLIVGKEVIDYLLLRAERSFAAAKTIVDLLDFRSMSEKVPITRPFTAKILKEYYEEQLNV